MERKQSIPLPNEAARENYTDSEIGEARERRPDLQTGQRLKSSPKILVSLSTADSEAGMTKRVRVRILQREMRLDLSLAAKIPK